MGYLLQASLHITQLEYGHSTNFLANNNPNISISKVTPTWLTRLHQNFLEKEDGQRCCNKWEIATLQTSQHKEIWSCQTCSGNYSEKHSSSSKSL